MRSRDKQGLNQAVNQQLSIVSIESANTRETEAESAFERVAAHWRLRAAAWGGPAHRLLSPGTAIGQRLTRELRRYDADTIIAAIDYVSLARDSRAAYFRGETDGPKRDLLTLLRHVESYAEAWDACPRDEPPSRPPPTEADVEAARARKRAERIRDTPVYRELIAAGRAARAARLALPEKPTEPE